MCCVLRSDNHCGKKKKKGRTKDTELLVLAGGGEESSIVVPRPVGEEALVDVGKDEGLGTSSLEIPESDLLVSCH